MSVLVRRSNLLVGIDDAAAIQEAWRCSADAITLDLTGADAKSLGGLREAIATAGQGAAEVFVRVTPATFDAHCAAAVCAGLRGVMLDHVTTAEQVSAADAKLAELERTAKLPANSLQLILVIGTAGAVWHVRAILKGSSRVSQIVLDEPALARDLAITPERELDPFEYARGRIVVESIAAKVMPVGIAYPLSVFPQGATDVVVHTHAVKGKNLGMKGVLCTDPAWVAPVNRAFTPTPELVNYNKRVREAFAAGVAAGTAAVPLDGRMIDVPVDEWAIVVLETAEACAARDAEKLAAMTARRK